MITLNVNIDHIATLRNARGGVEPDPASAVFIAEIAGATGIVAHLREDRRHMMDRDIFLLKEIIQTKFDLEMAATPEIIQIALKVKPDLVTIVPEKRQELTTEGGLDVRVNHQNLSDLCKIMHDNGIEVSLFVDPDHSQIEESKLVGADMVELHTGTYANAFKDSVRNSELEKLKEASIFANSLDMLIAAGHGLNYTNTQAVCRVPFIKEMSIGHSIIARSSLVGLDRAVRDMLNILQTHS